MEKQKILEETKIILKKATGIVATIFVYGTCSYLSKKTQPIKKQTIIYKSSLLDSSYGCAASAIVNSDMFSVDREKALQSLLPDKPESYYEAVISIAGGDMLSIDKKKAICSLAERW